MKITFTCEKCGVQVGCPMTGVRAGSAVSLPYHDCSLAYGPLTEEMVAAALAEVVAEEEDCSQPMELYRGQARFVLRLLNSEKFREPWVHWEGYTSEGMRKVYRDNLLELAREK